MCRDLSTDDRKTPALIVTILSVGVILCGLVMAIMSIVFTTDEDSVFAADFGEY